MHALLLLALVGVSQAQAATLEMCRQKTSDLLAVSTCVLAERQRAANQLRETNKSALDVVDHRVRSDGNKNALRAFRLSQSRHVRARANGCRNEAGDTARIGCEADADFTQIDYLTQLAKRNSVR